MANKRLLGASAALVALTSLIINTIDKNQQVQAYPSVSHQTATAIAQNRAPLQIAFPTRKDSTDLQSKANRVAQFLSRELGMPVKAVVADETAAVEALRANRVDVAFLSSRPALKAEQLAGSRLALAEVRPEYSGGNTYRSVFVVRKNSPLRTQKTAQQTLNQLKGKKMAFASRTSGSGFIVPTGELVGKKLVAGPDKLEGFFSRVTYGDGYSSALQAVLRGQADVATVSEYALKSPWITPQEAQQLRVLHAIPGVPAHGIAIDNDVPAATRDRLITALLKLNQPQNNAMLRALYNSTELRRIDHNRHLAPMRQALQRAKLQP